jgi:hypothetical protein
MAVVTVGEMLDRALDFEVRLEAYYAELRDRSTVDGVRILTHYLARHKRHVPEALEPFTAVDLHHIRLAPMKYDDTDFHPAHCFEGRGLPADATGEQLLDVSIEFVDTLIRFYHWMLQQPLGPGPQGLFQSLLRIEERDVIELKKIKAMDYF